jgi:hypothetical protein
MTGHSGQDGTPIEDYLDQLLTTSAGMTARQRRHLLSEVEDHLRATAEHSIAAGDEPDDAEREAVARFGPALDVIRADRVSHGSATGAFLRRLVNTGALLAGIGAVAIGVSGAIAAVIRLIGGNSALVAAPNSGSLAPSDCARWLQLDPHAASCSAAAVANWADETVFYRLALGLFGVLLLAVRLAVLRRRPDAGARTLPALATYTIAALLFGGASLWILGAGVDTLATSPNAGAGQWFSAAPVALVATIYFAIRVHREVNRSPL